MAKSRAIMVLLWLLSAFVAGNAIAETVALRAGIHSGFGRLVMDWPNAVSAKLQQDGLRVALQFQRAFEADLGKITRHLDIYVRSANIAADGKQLVLELRQPVQATLRPMESNLVVLDLLEPSDTKAGQVDVRVGVHDGFSRLVVDLRHEQPYQLDTAGDTVTVSFSNALDFALDKVQRRPPKGVRQVRQETADGQTRLLLTLQPGYGARSFQRGPALAFDIARQQPAQTPPATDSAVSAAAKPLPRPWQRKPDIARLRNNSRPAAPSNAESVSQAALPQTALPAEPGPNRQVTATALQPLPSQPAESAAPATAEVAAKEVRDIAARQESATAVPVQETEGEAIAPQASDPLAALTPSAGSEGEAIAPNTEANTETEAQTETDAQTEIAATGEAQPTSLSFTAENGLQVDFEEAANAATFRFTWPQPVPAAGFQRAGYTWIIFASPDVLDLSAVGRAEGIVHMAQQVRNNRATVLRFRTRQGSYLSMERQRETWIARLTPVATPPEAAINVVAQPYANDGAQVFLPIIDSAKRITVYDPEVGDEIHTVPVQPSSHGIAKARRFVEFALLPTAQGIALRPISDGITLEHRHNGIFVRDQQPLSLSKPEVSGMSRRSASVGRGFKGPLLNLASWRGDPDIPVNDRHHALLSWLVRSPESGRDLARWQLAKFHFAHGMNDQALGYQKLMSENDEFAEEDVEFRAVRGISALLLNRLEEAGHDLSHPDLDRYQDIALWRGMLAFEQQKYGEAQQAFAAGASTISDLPKRLQQKILLAWAETAVARNDVEAFNLIAPSLDALSDDREVEGHLAYFRGAMADAADNRKLAMRHYSAAQQSESRRARAMAARRLVEVQLAEEEIERDEALARLEALFFAWRETDYEVGLKRRMAELALREAQYRKGLSLLREIASGFTGEPQKSATKRMSEVFEELFLSAAADEIPPIQALALFEDFQELTPYGEAGDEMIRRLADRLIQVDLLGRAARLLAHQVDFRLQGNLKAETGTRLAMVYLMDKQPEEALRALKRTEWALASENLQTQRKYIRARALVEAGKDEAALAAIKDDNSTIANFIRSDIHWRRRDWAAAGNVIAGQLGNAAASPAPLNPVQQKLVVKLIVATYMNGDNQQLQALAERYKGKMAGSKHEHTFRVLTGRVDAQATEFRQLAGAIAATSDLDAFMDSYRRQLSSEAAARNTQPAS